jgi:hypothetical protein
MRYWAGLYPKNSQESIKESVDLMMQTAIKLLKVQGGGKTLKMLKNAGASKQDGGGASMGGDSV